MALRCLLFTSDAGTATPVLQVLAGLDVEAEHCSEALATVDKVTHQNFQLVIIDWDQQPEAGLLLTAARERKAAERPLTLAMVSDDASVPQALQAGANSILRKPIVVHQVKDTLTTARDLLRSKQESAATAVHAAAAGASAASVATIPHGTEPSEEKALRAGEFLHSAGTAPGGQFETDSDVHESLAPTSVEPVDPLRDLEPMAASVSANVAEQSTVPTPPPQPASNETHGLEWFLKTRAGAAAPPISARPSPPPAPAKPELVGFEQPYSPTPSASSSHETLRPAPERKPNQPDLQEQRQEQKKEAQLFAYIEGGSTDAEEKSRPRFRHRGAIIGALLLASCAIVVAPQAPWHPKLLGFWAHEQQAFRSWLNPQPVTPPQAPAAHENFGRAGDEYKLPVAETIPDATTDPSQIQVLPVVDPTIKKPNSLGGNAIQLPPDATAATPGDQAPSSGAQPPENQAGQPAPDSTQPVTTTAEAPPSPAPTAVAPGVSAPQHSDPFTAAPQPAVSVPARPKSQEQHSAATPANVPSSLKSHMALMAPDTGGNKSPESAMPSIEPVSVPEFTERALLSEQPEIAYPANPKAQPGTVILQVLIGRDGTVQDAKFMQGSLAFARSAIDGVRRWKFKPYVMNGRPVSVQTLLTMSFKPAS
ncbi:MAG TPA: TonB family protein [Candidatus Sulfotelmatobacter sp.]